MLLGAMLIAAYPASANAQSADDHADEWTEARRGDRDWMQRATEQLTTGVSERVMGRPPQGPMKIAVNYVFDEVVRMRDSVRNPCLAAALEKAHDQVIASGRQVVMAGSLDMFLSAAGGAAGGGEIRQFLSRRLIGQVGEVLKGSALDKFKGEMRDAMKAGQPEYWSDWDRREGCTTEYRGVWDKNAERYYFLIAGDCQCKDVTCGPKVGGTVRLRRWTIEGWGTVVPEIEQRANGDKVVRFTVGRPQDVNLTADCCGRDRPSFRTMPNDGPGNAWVGYVPPPQVAPPQTQPPSRPQTGGTTPATGQTGTTGTTPRPTLPPRINIPVIPDGPLTDPELEQLEQRVFDAEQLAQSEHRAAVSRTEALVKSNSTAEEIAAARAAEAAALETYRRTRAARDALRDKINQQQPQDQSSIMPLQRLDRSSAAILAVHNQERAAVGVAPLQWDSMLATSALAYAGHLARGGPFVHAPRAGREKERENLSRGLPGASAERMMTNWTNEKSNFIPGTYPNVSKTGNWYDVSHYTQMIWPTTTRVGCGTANGSKYAVLVCRYTPPGNRDGSPILADNATIVRPDLPRIPMGGGMQRIDPPAPPPPSRPTAADDAPDGNEARHPLATLFAGALNRHYEALRNCDRAAAERALDDMRYALDELRKRLKAARAVGGFSTVNPDDLQRLIDGLDRVLRGAEQRNSPGTCPPR